MPGKELTISLPEKFRPFCTSTCRYLVAWGGRASGKSFSFAIILLLKSLQKKIKVLCVREVQNSIKESVYETLKISMDIIGVRDLFECTNNSIVCKVTGSTFLFSGLLRNTESIKSIPGISHVWCAEANKISEESLQLLFPTIREQDSQIWIEFNPEYESDAAFKRFVANTTPDSLVVNVNWQDNPFVSDTILKEKDSDYATRPEDADWIWAGKLRRVGANVWAPPFDESLHVKTIDLSQIKEVKYFQALDPHTSFYSASCWAARWKQGDRFYTYIFEEWPKHSDVGADYYEIRKTKHYTGTVADLSRTFFAIETGITITQRYIDTRFAKGFGSQQSNLINTTEGLVQTFAKPQNGGILYLLPPEVAIDAANDIIKAGMRYNILAERTAINEPCFYIHPRCKNMILAFKNHRYDEGNEKENEIYKDFSDLSTILIGGLSGYRWPNKKKEHFDGGYKGEGGWQGN